MRRTILDEYRARHQATPFQRLIADVRCLVNLAWQVRMHTEHGGYFVSGCAFCDMRR